MAGQNGDRGGPPLMFTPTWVAALVCSVIIALSLAIEKLLHLLSKRLKRMNRRFLFKALQKLKEELMLMGIISLLLVRMQDEIVKICIPVSWANKGLPCNVSKDINAGSNATTTVHISIKRHLLAEDTSTTGYSYCHHKGKVPLLSYHALHDLHILIFVLAVVHVVVCALTVLFGAAKISQWRRWEESILEKIHVIDNVYTEDKIIHVKNDDFIKKRFMGIHANKRIWLRSFGKHLYGSVTESDYATMRLGFVLTHCRGISNFNFFDYMMHAFEADFMEVVTISWYVWGIVIISLLLNLAGWHTYFWIAFLPLTLLLIVGTKLEQVITLLATEVAQTQSVAVGDVKIQPSDHYFWFHKPRIFFLLIRIIISCNSIAVAVFFWIYSRQGLHACGMDRSIFTIPKLIIVAFVQILCSYSTLPLYLIVTQMGSSYHKKAMEICSYGTDGAHMKSRRSEANHAPTETIQLA